MSESRDEAETVRYLDGIFGPGAGERHCAFLRTLADPALRGLIHGYHGVEADTTELSLRENYLLGMVVLCATRSHGTAAMFAKTLLHLGERKERLLAAVGRLAMWVGGIPAVEATMHIQRAIGEYEAQGLVSMAGWFPGVK